MSETTPSTSRLRRVDEDRVHGGLHARRVALVAQAEVGCERVGADVGALRLAAIRAHALVGGEVDLHSGAGGDDRPDVAALHHRVGLGGELALALAHHRPHLRVLGDDGNRPVDAGIADRQGHILARDGDVAILVELDRVPGRQLPEALPVLERDVLPQRQPRHGSVHGPGVEVADTEPLGEAACDRALAGPCGPVDGDDHRLASDVEKLVEAGERYRRRVRALDAYALLRDEAGDGADDRDAVVAGGVELAASRPRRHAADGVATGGRPHAGADRPQRRRHRIDAVRLLRAQLRSSTHPARAARHRRREREQRQLVDHPRHLGGDDLRRDELGVRHLEVGHRLARLRCAG